MIIPYSKKFMEKFGDTVHQEQRKHFFILKPIWWVIDWRNKRKLTHLSTWLKNQVINSSDDLIKLSKELKGKKDDETIINILRWVHDNVKYVGDQEKWGTPEYWESAQNVYETKEADCESGSTLIYVLAILAGIPYYQLRIAAGTVMGGGHAYVLYEADRDGVERIIDWCYYFDNAIMSRRKFYKNDNRYISEWFSFNHRYSYNGDTK